MKINSQLNLGAMLPTASEQEIKTEPMLFRCDAEHAFDLGGQLTKLFLNFLPQDWIKSKLSIDSRVHMLMPGMYPCIPGWHHDDVPRSRSDGQPNYETPEYKAEHCMALFGDCSRTEFAIGDGEFEIPPIGAKIYKTWHHDVEAACNLGVLKRIVAPTERQIFFDWNTWHRGAETTHRGFRFFIRATRFSNVRLVNERRFNANVYMPVIEEGW